MQVFVFFFVCVVESGTSNSSERYCVALACDWDLGFTVLYAHLAWTSEISIPLPDNTDAEGDDAARGAKVGDEWIGLTLGRDDKGAGLLHPGDRGIKTSGGCRCL